MMGSPSPPGRPESGGRERLVEVRRAGCSRVSRVGFLGLLECSASVPGAEGPERIAPARSALQGDSAIPLGSIGARRRRTVDPASVWPSRRPGRPSSTPEPAGSARARSPATPRTGRSSIHRDAHHGAGPSQARQPMPPSPPRPAPRRPQPGESISAVLRSWLQCSALTRTSIRAHVLSSARVGGRPEADSVRQRPAPAAVCPYSAGSSRRGVPPLAVALGSAFGATNRPSGGGSLRST